MAGRRIMLELVSLLVICISQTSHGFTLFSSLNRTLAVDSSATAGQVLKPGEDTITVTWAYKGTDDSSYKTVEIHLCYAPISQKDRGWRRTADNLEKDKTCPLLVVASPYSPSSRNGSFVWLVEEDVPPATYFIRAYALDAGRHRLGYGQTTDDEKATNLFEVVAVTGRHASLAIASACFSAFSVVSFAGLLTAEKIGGKTM
ncbi:hypothetical protein SAY87_003235 [Trapa incisa]|uniref:High-affinity nitrate transporter n=1 Tax=Trapa incisa TaxID=236973 RepID=A0AAN7QHR8_9MYRT|nr:hypothetical protein SAY87_003235 [Trapa incisa]